MDKQTVMCSHSGVLFSHEEDGMLTHMWHGTVMIHLENVMVHLRSQSHRTTNGGVCPTWAKPYRQTGDESFPTVGKHGVEDWLLMGLGFAEQWKLSEYSRLWQWAQNPVAVLRITETYFEFYNRN